MSTKKALLIGINYRGTSSALRGCIQDVDNMRLYLISKGFARTDITVMTDDTKKRRPTRRNIIMAILELVMSGAEQLFLHYSGHGSWGNDANSDEKDSRDESLVPLDYKKAGMLTDDQLRGLLCLLPTTSRMTVILDCCHSGTGMDLAYSFKETNDWVREKRNKKWFRVQKKVSKMVKDPAYRETPAPVVFISGCMDLQTSADAYEEGRFQGALTFCLLKVLREHDATPKTWTELITQLRKLLKSRRYKQIANLTSGQALKVTEKASLF
jgi:hypothetical protein